MTTPRDAIGLSDRLRQWVTDWDGSQMQDGEPPRDGIHCDIIREAATALDALQARVEELEAKAAALFWSIPDDIAAQIKCGDLQKRAAELLDAESRATSAEQERDELRGLLLLCGELGGIGKDETPVAYLRRLIDGLIERDEAYERAAQCAECIADEYDATSFTSVVAGQVAALRSKEQAAHEIAAAIRRLAAGTEKEKRE